MYYVYILASLKDTTKVYLSLDQVGIEVAALN